MKKTSLLLILLFIFTSLSHAQLISERTEGKVIIGADLFTDFSTGKTYENFDFENTPFLASIGLGYTGHNFYMKGAYLDKPYDEITVFENVIYDYERSKINTNYFDIPVEVSVKLRDQFKISAGFKFGILTYGKSKYVGNLDNDEITYRIKYGKINNLEKYVYSLTFRAAYKCVHVFMAYQFSDTFKNGYGPEIKPISIGIGVRPF